MTLGIGNLSVKVGDINKRGEITFHFATLIQKIIA